MILREIHIDGFGVHRDLRHGLSPNLNLIVGPNEAGKSTLHAFVRGLLYGFPRGNTKETRYAALRGGRHGGALSVEADGGVYRILRSGEPRHTLSVELPGGGVGGKEVLDQLLRTTDAQLFRNVFAFGLDELMDFGGLMGREMEMRIFDTAVSGAGRSVTEIVGKLREIQQEELSARKGRVRELASQIGDLEKELRGAQTRAKGYADLASEETRLAQSLAEVKTRAEEARREVSRLEALVALWPTERRRQEAIERLRELPQREAGALPIGAERLDRFDHIREQLEELGSADEERRLREQRLQRELALAAPDEGLRAVADRAEALLRDQRLQADRRERILALRLAIEQRAEGASRLLGSLGPRWTEELVRRVDRSLSRREEVDAFAARFRDLEREREPLLAALRRAEDAAAEAARQLEETRLLVEEHGEAAPAEALDRRAGALAELRAAREERLQLERRLASIRDQRRAAGERPAVAGAGGRIRPALWAGAGAFAVVAVLAFLSASTSAAAVAAMAALLLLAFALTWRAPVAAAPGAVGDAAGAEAEVEELLVRCDEAMRRHAEGAGVPGAAGASEIEAAAEALQRARVHRHRWEDLHRELRDRQRRERDTAAASAAAREARDRMEEVADALQREWVRCIESVFGEIAREGLLGAGAGADADAGAGADPGPEDGAGVGAGEGAGAVPLSPEAVRARLVRVDDAVKLLEERARDRAELDRLETSVEGWDRELAEVAALAGIQGGGEEALGRLSDALEVERKKEGDRRLLEGSLVELGEELQLAAGSRERLEADAAAILGEAGARDREGLAARIEEDRRRVEAEEAIAAAQRVIEERLGLGSDARELRRELERGEVGSWEAERERAQAEAAARAEELEGLIARLTLASEERKKLEASADVPRISAGLAERRAELEEAVRRWRMAALLERLLQRSLDDLRRERQPAVLKAAGEAFSGITGGRYTAILQRMEGDGVEVLDQSGERIAASALSRGAREQLYICVRLGLAAAFAEQGTRLPLLLDDVLVNFDPERAERGARVLVDHAARHQTLLFTCHPKTVERMLALCPEAAVLELAG